jgi:hypothetical protein
MLSQPFLRRMGGDSSIMSSGRYSTLWFFPDERPKIVDRSLTAIFKKWQRAWHWVFLVNFRRQHSALKDVTMQPFDRQMHKTKNH